MRMELQVRPELHDGKVRLVMHGPQDDAALDVTDTLTREKVVVKLNAEDGEVLYVLCEVEVEGMWKPGSPGYFNPYDGGHPPESDCVEDLMVSLGQLDLTDLLTEDQIEAAENHLRDLANDRD